MCTEFSWHHFQVNKSMKKFYGLAERPILPRVTVVIFKERDGIFDQTNLNPILPEFINGYIHLIDN